MSSPNITCLVLDLFGVIVRFDDGLAYERISSRCSNPLLARRQMHDLVSDPALIRGNITLEQLHARLVDELGLSSSFGEFTAMWIASYSEPMPGIRELLRELVGQCRLVLLSNVDRYYWPTVRASIPELEHFDAHVLSFEQGVAKPEAEAFDRAVRAGGTTPKQCYFVDDKRENVEAAASHEIAGHVFESPSALRAELRRTGLRV